MQVFWSCCGHLALLCLQQLLASLAYQSHHHSKLSKTEISPFSRPLKSWNIKHTLYYSFSPSPSPKGDVAELYYWPVYWPVSAILPIFWSSSKPPSSLLFSVPPRHVEYAKSHQCSNISKMESIPLKSRNTGCMLQLLPSSGRARRKPPLLIPHEHMRAYTLGYS